MKFPDPVLPKLRFDAVSDFSCGLALVQNGNRSGFIDRNGKLVVALHLERAYPFREGFSRVVINGKYGYLDTTGRTAIPPQFDWAGDFHEGYAVVGFSGNDGSKPFFYVGFDRGNDQVRYAVIDGSGKVTARLLPGDKPDAQVSDGLLSFSRCVPGKKQPGKDRNAMFPQGMEYPHNPQSPGYEVLYGYMNPYGKIVLKAQYNMGARFSKGLASVLVNFEPKTIDKTGKSVTHRAEPGPNRLLDLPKGLTPVSLNNKYGYSDISGKLVIPYQFDDAARFSEGLGAVELGRRQWKGVNWAFFEFWNDNRCSCQTGSPWEERSALGKYGYIDTAGRMVIPTQFDVARPFHEGFAAVAVGDKWHFIDKTGRPLTIRP